MLQGHIAQIQKYYFLAYNMLFFLRNLNFFKYLVFVYFLRNFLNLDVNLVKQKVHEVMFLAVLAL